jgi:hypothetical protein
MTGDDALAGKLKQHSACSCTPPRCNFYFFNIYYVPANLYFCVSGMLAWLLFYFYLAFFDFFFGFFFFLLCGHLLQRGSPSLFLLLALD